MIRDLRGASWRKSSFSADAGECVEVASNLPGVVGVRDSKDLAGSALTCAPGEWATFLSGIKGGHFNT
ncbi:DUF397 domain-containing protein [Sphaerisporangium fuscum]|uniref:DUF397 domain-containing protein n=1 Tax=Sphaerisporangium fuscum TaxID=2835868 RepID=UPI001BDCE407|nr:DUF397 domain-containing protein [Sphaerisporangium fuscum]